MLSEHTATIALGLHDDRVQRGVSCKLYRAQSNYTHDTTPSRDWDGGMHVLKYEG